MKINCDISKQYFPCYDEAKGVALKKKQILKNKNAKVLSYMQQVLLKFFLIAILNFFFAILLGDSYYPCFILILILDDIFVLFHFIETIKTYLIRKNQKFKNTIKLEESGLIDQSYFGIEMKFSWDKIKAVVIKKYSITILTDTPCFFYFDTSKKEKIKEIIKKYSPKTLIIE